MIYGEVSDTYTYVCKPGCQEERDDVREGVIREGAERKGKARSVADWFLICFENIDRVRFLSCTCFFAVTNNNESSLRFCTCILTVSHSNDKFLQKNILSPRGKPTILQFCTNQLTY